MNKSITVCIPTSLNSIEFFIELMISISNQTLLPNHILIILNGKNKTREIFEKLIKKVSKLIPSNIKPKFIIADRFGLSHARNIGIDKCKTDILIFGDDDDIWDKNKIYLLHETILKNGECLVTHRFNHLFKNKIKPSPIKFKYKPNIFLIGIANFAGGGSSLSGSTCIFKTVKFNETLFSCEDWDFWIRIYLIGIPIFNIKNELVSYRIHPDRMSKRINDLFIYENFIRLRYLQKILKFMFGLILGFIRLLLKYILEIFYSLFSKTK